MLFQDLTDTVDQIKADNTLYYGDFGFDFAFEWDGNVLCDLTVNWPSVSSTSVVDAFRFAEALQSFCFEGRHLIGTVIDD